jgi:hypothetical protein
LDKVDTTELPGNDASWYRALLEETSPSAPTDLPPPPAVPDTTDDVETTVEAPPVTQPDPTDIDSAAVEPPIQESVGLLPVDEASVAEPEVGELVSQAREPEPDIPPAFRTAPHEDVDEPSDASESPPVEAIDTDDVPPETLASGESPESEPEPTPESNAVADRELSPGQKQSEVVGQLWTAHPPEGPIEGWEPDDIDRAMSSARSFRWTSVIAILAIVAVVAVGLVLLPSITRNRAAAHREMMREALHELRDELPDAQTSLAVATEPTSTVTALNDLSTELTALSAKATAVDTAGRRPLPSTLPLTSSEPIDELTAISQRLGPLAATALTIQRRIANVVEYRTLMDGFLTLPDLPTTADESEQADLRVTLASTQAESASILSELPEDESLAEHRALAKELNETFATWQVDYLDALRTRDEVAAEALIGDLQFQIDQLNAALVGPLAQIRRQSDADIIDLAATIDEVDAVAAEQS